MNYNYKEVKMQQKTKASMGMLLEFVLLVAVVALVAVLVFQVNADTRADLTAGSIAYNATIDADEAVAKIPSNLKILATAVVFGAIIYVITRVIPIGRSVSSSSF